MYLNHNTAVSVDTGDFKKLLDFIASNSPLYVLTGAGCSTDSGIPDYRDDNGDWKYSKPVQYIEFISNIAVRKRYWARSMVGWHRVADAIPNPAHISLARLEGSGLIHHLVTQNVDGLHGKAGSRRVLELHGNLENVICIDCRHNTPRWQIQDFLVNENSRFKMDYQGPAPDGDTVAGDVDYKYFNIPACNKCNGILKPDVVFFGESVPKNRVVTATRKLTESKGMLIVGSSLMVYSGYRFVREAIKQKIPVAAINLGRTRADQVLSLKYQSQCGPVLEKLSQHLSP